MTIIAVPKTPASAYDPGRPASALLQAQIEHLEHAIGKEPQTGVGRTERQAAKYIAELTAEVLRQQRKSAALPNPAGGMAGPNGTKHTPTKRHADLVQKMRARNTAKRKKPAKAKRPAAKRPAAKRSATKRRRSR
jgi:hypothetical protein